LNGIILFEFCSAYPKNLFAKEVNKKKLEEINIKYQQLSSNNIDYFFRTSNANYFSRNKVVKELKENGDKFFNLLALEKSDSKINNFVDINSDIQYREKEVFYAEGNAIINFSDAILKGDLITYDLENKLLTVVGNVIFKKGEQYFEASKLYFDLKNDTGYIEDIYGILNNKTFSEDFKFENNRKLIDQNNQLGQQTNSFNFPIGLENDLSESKAFKVKSANLNNFTIRKLRYKADKLIYNSKTLESKKIFFTNDIYNDPQFIFLSKNFSAEIVDEKLRLLSRNSWIILDNKLNIPIGRQSLLEGDSFINWGFGADYKDKDGYYLSRGFYPGKLFKDFSFQYTPYFLIQRALKGSTNSFTAKNSSVFSEKVESDINVSDYFAMDLNIKGSIYDWNVESNIQLNSLNTERLGDSLRSKLIFNKRINLNEKVKVNKDLISDRDRSYFKRKETKDVSSIIGKQIEINRIKPFSEKNEKVFNNFLDLKFYNFYREEVIKDFATEEIYFASGFNVSNKRSWAVDDKNSNLNFVYDVGHFKSKSSNEEEFKDLFRNSFVAEYNYEFPLWKKKKLDKFIDKGYTYSPIVIPQSLNWSTGLKSGIFLYSDGSSQSALNFNAGPVLTYGSFKKKFLDFTKVGAIYSYVLKGGESPFRFDNLEEDPRINFYLQQQIYGPLVFSLDTILNLNNGTYSNVEYALDFKRRAYSLGAFYNSSNESLGIRFNIFNFDYLGLNKKF
jgi:hypothetical protein